MKRVLLTGATGFIGRHTLEPLLARGFEVHAVSSKGELSGAPARIRWHRADLLNPARVGELLESVRPTHLLHLAWYAVPGKFWTAEENRSWVKASTDLLHAFARCGGRRVVMTGTCAEYDWGTGVCSEAETAVAPHTLYGACKNWARIILESFSTEKGISWAWARIFFLYGAHEPEEKLVAYVISSLLRGEPALCSHGKQLRDFLYVEDVADALVALLESSVEGAVNVASGEATALRSIIQSIGEKIGRPDLIRLGAKQAPADEPHMIVGSNTRLSEEVGWRPRFDLDRGLDQSIRFWRERVKA